MIPCCSFCNRSSIACFSFCVNHLASLGLSFTSIHQKNAQIIAGNPSRINIHRQPREFIRYPETTDIHSTVTGLPRIKNVLARERSALVNQRLIKMSMEGNIALSTTPSINRIAIKKFTLLVRPVAVAKAPHRINDQKINFFVLLLAA